MLPEAAIHSEGEESRARGISLASGSVCHALNNMLFSQIPVEFMLIRKQSETGRFPRVCPQLLCSVAISRYG
jgi:hypothetical protein